MTSGDNKEVMEEVWFEWKSNSYGTSLSKLSLTLLCEIASVSGRANKLKDD